MNAKLHFLTGMCLLWPLFFADRTASAGELYGIGVALANHPGGFLVKTVISNSPAAVEGTIKAGDLIVAVAESNAAPTSLEAIASVEEAVAKIRGPKGSLIRLTVVPGATNANQTRIVTLARGELRSMAFGGLWQSLTNGAVAPNVTFIRLPAKQEETLHDYRGKVVILEFWATWCAPCLAMMPRIQEEADVLAARKGVAIMSVSIDDDPDAAWRLLQKNHWTKVQNRWGGPKMAEAFGVHFVPMMTIINRDGKIVYIGSPLTLEELHPFLDKD